MIMMMTKSPKDYDDDLPMMMLMIMNSLPKVLFIMFSMFLSHDDANNDNELPV